jgi:hypothetical protein
VKLKSTHSRGLATRLQCFVKPLPENAQCSGVFTRQACWLFPNAEPPRREQRSLSHIPGKRENARSNEE